MDYLPQLRSPFLIDIPPLLVYIVPNAKKERYHAHSEIQVCF